MINYGKYAKTIIAVITAIVGWITQVSVSASSSITSAEWVALVTYLAIALGVYVLPNAKE